MTKYLAVDLGAESGRVVVGHLDHTGLSLEETCRFPNGPVTVQGSLHWNVLGLWAEIKQGLAITSAAHGDQIKSVGLDTWGVDYGLLTETGMLLGNPYHYRDSRTDGKMAEVFGVVPMAEIYEQTGIQMMQINSLFQLYAMTQTDPVALDSARTFLNMPDLLNFWLSGVKVSEFTISSTSQCYNPRRGDWAHDVIARLGIPGGIFGPVVQPGTILDELAPSIAREIGAPPLTVVASAGHDTASAVAAVPAASRDYIYLSSGTWSLMGVELDEPIINDKSRDYNLTNEGGVDGTIRYLSNIMGLWLVQECRREWAKAGKSLSYDELTQMAAGAPAFGSLVALNDERFLPPGDMPSRIQAYCRDTGQNVPQTRGEIVRCALESLALEYRVVADRLEDMVGRPLPTIHIIGGGSQNRLLNQFAADATGKIVAAGPIEATAIGNILVQAIALGEIDSLAAGRDLVRHSFPVDTFLPQANAGWAEAYARYASLSAGHVG